MAFALSEFEPHMEGGGAVDDGCAYKQEQLRRGENGEVSFFKKKIRMWI